MAEDSTGQAPNVRQSDLSRDLRCCNRRWRHGGRASRPNPTSSFPKRSSCWRPWGRLTSSFARWNESPEWNGLPRSNRKNFLRTTISLRWNEHGEARLDRLLRGRLFMVFANQAALAQMLSLWNDWQSDNRLPHGLGKWKTLFQQLRDVRRWGVQDRLLEPGVLDDWRERAEFGRDVVPCEVELWYRRNPEVRRMARNRVVALVEALDGQVVKEADIQEIAYHALLVRLPVEQVRPLFESLDNDIGLVQCEQVQFFRARRADVFFTAG